jgi:hypothetical protein
MVHMEDNSFLLFSLVFIYFESGSRRPGWLGILYGAYVLYIGKKHTFVVW